MSAFKDMVAADIHGVFLNNQEFAEDRTVKYDGNVFEDISVVLNGIKQSERKQLVFDHTQGLYLVTDIMHCALSDLGGHMPEKGRIISISEPDVPGFFRDYLVASVQNTDGMLRIELEVTDE